MFVFKFQGAVSCLQARWLHLQEYQSKGLMREHDIEVQHFEVVDSAEEAKSVPSRLSMYYKCDIILHGRVTIKHLWQS